MMELFIKLENGQIVDHPIIKENLLQVYPDLDLNNLPEWLLPFERVQPPMVGPYEKNLRCVYEIANNIAKDVWYIDQMTPEEKLAKQTAVKDAWAGIGFASWIFDENLCDFVPPIPHPNDGNVYAWNEDEQKWVLP